MVGCVGVKKCKNILKSMEKLIKLSVQKAICFIFLTIMFYFARISLIVEMGCYIHQKFLTEASCS